MTILSNGLQLSDEGQHVLKIAQAIAKENMSSSMAPAHVLKALLHKDAGLHAILKQLDKDIYYLEEWAEVRIEMQTKSSSLPAVIAGDEKIEELMNEAEHIRMKMLKESIEPLHLLAALSTPGVCFSYEQLKSFPLRREELMTTEVAVEEINSIVQGNKSGGTVPGGKKEQFALLKYCIDKIVQARENKTDVIIGRDRETRMMAEILCRRSKPNVLIVGDAGVGKSALVDGFAHAVCRGKVPQALLNAQILELNTGALIAGASYKGEIEDRLKSIITEIKQFDKAILFIDEIHALIDKNGAGAGAINLLKPELARGEITLIGATTLDEYRKTIQADDAFNRRFELLVVEEPDGELCFQMIKAVVPYYEKHHHIEVPDESIKETIRLAKRYIKDKRLPDSALDLIDRSMAALHLINDTGARDIEELQQTIEAWEEQGVNGNPHTLEDWRWMHLQIKQKVSPVLWAYLEQEEDLSEVTDVAALVLHLKVVTDALQAVAAQPRYQLEKSDVAAIVSYKTGIPIGKVRSGEKEKLLNMEAILQQRVVGQNRAIKTITDAILESRSGLNKQGQPIGSFFFLGPTGTGKTELTKALAEFLFQDESFIIRFDMSEFKEEHAAALLYGAPPGYVGYQEGGLLVNKIRQKPYSVVLFDEIEKAHASVFDVFLQIMDEGKLHDKLGKEGDFSNALIIFTSNIGSQYIEEAVSRNEMPSSARLMEMMASYFRPEFLGRLTEIVPFVPMTLDMVQNILQIQLKGLHQTLQKKGIQLTVSERAQNLLAQMGFTPRYGARPLSGVIRSQLRRPLSRKIITGEIGQNSCVHLDVDDRNELCWMVEMEYEEIT